jgi:hypothetical protein
VPLAAVVVGGLLGGAGLFGLFRGVNAEPLPLPAPPTDPGTTLPVPPIPPADASPLPPIQQAGAVLPPITPLPAPPLPKPDPTIPTVPPPVGSPAPLPPVTAKPELPPLPPAPPAKIDPVPVEPAAKPADPLPLIPPPVAPPPVLPKPDPAPSKPADPLPPLPKPAEVPQPVQPVTPADPLPPIPPAKPENGLRPDAKPLTVNPGPPPVGSETLPPPRKVGNETIPPPRPVVETSVTPTPKPDGVVPIAAPFTPGSTPMTPAPRTALMTALVGAALASTPAFADDPKPADPKADAESMKAVLKEIADLKADVKLLKEEKAKLEKVLFGIGDSQRKTADEKGKLMQMEEGQKKAQEELDKMAAKVKDLETQLAQKSVSAKQSVEGATPGKGTVKLVNEYNVKVSMIVNGTSYPLGVNEVKTIEVPEGKLKYELVEFPNAMTKETSIKEGETVTLRIK